MKSMIVGMFTAAALTAAGFAGASATQISGKLPDANASSTAILKHVQYGSYCQRLRYACVYRERLGERGEGNCARYRRECGGRSNYCEHLRNACIYKESRGEVGEGNCRRYRAECRGG